MEMLLGHNFNRICQAKCDNFGHCIIHIGYQLMSYYIETAMHMQCNPPHKLCLLHHVHWYHSVVCYLSYMYV